MADRSETLLDRIDFEAIADSGDKVRECEFFLGKAAVETDRSRFRWLIGAYLNAVYSYFEISAVRASVALTDPETGDLTEDSGAVDALQRYVRLDRNKKNPLFIKTAGTHPFIARIYAVRGTATHRFPLSISANGPSLPEDFCFGSYRGDGEPVLALCREVLAVIKQLEGELDS